MTITTHYENGQHVLYCTSHGRTAIAGERLFRGYPRPAISFAHPTLEAAQKDAETLQKYLDNPPKKSRAQNKRIGAFEEMDDPVWKV